MMKGDRNEDRNELGLSEKGEFRSDLASGFWLLASHSSLPILSRFVMLFMQNNYRKSMLFCIYVVELFCIYWSLLEKVR